MAKSREDLRNLMAGKDADKKKKQATKTNEEAQASINEQYAQETKEIIDRIDEEDAKIEEETSTTSNEQNQSVDDVIQSTNLERSADFLNATDAQKYEMMTFILGAESRDEIGTNDGIIDLDKVADCVLDKPEFKEFLEPFKDLNLHDRECNDKLLDAFIKGDISRDDMVDIETMCQNKERDGLIKGIKELGTIAKDAIEKMAERVPDIADSLSKDNIHIGPSINDILKDAKDRTNEDLVRDHSPMNRNNRDDDLTI